MCDIMPSISPDCTDCSPFILLAEPRGGSTMMIDNLRNHPEIVARGEVLFNTAFQDCHNAIYFANNEHCTFETLMNTLADGMVQDTQEHTKYFGAKGNYGQIPVDMLRQFAEWLYCNKVTLIQMSRSSVMASFYNYQDQGRDVLMSLLPPAVGATDGAQDTLTIDGSKAQTYIESVEQWRDSVRKLIKFYPHGEIPYFHIFYEDTLGKHADRHMNALWAFLGVKTIGKMEAGVVRAHAPTPCYQKVANWEDVERLIPDTDTAYACRVNRPT